MVVPTPAPLDLKNVQGDILMNGLPKKTETCFFFQIDKDHVKEFRTQLAHLVPLITSTAQVANDRDKIAQSKKDAAEHKYDPPLLELTGVNIAFSSKGIAQMGIHDEIGDNAFDQGMLLGAKALGDKGTQLPTGFVPDWDPAFKQEMHGLILVTGESHASVDTRLGEVKQIFSVGAHNASIHEVFRTTGDVRPGAEKGHEHFGFQDGISQPAVKGVDTETFPGQETVRQGIILVGREGDAPNVGTTRPSWALDGSFLSFRYLEQLVPEFDAFLKHNPIPGLPPSEGSELLGARLVGRWKSGAPVDLFPIKDDPAAGANPQKNNNFHYSFPDDPQTQDRCPFAAHLRKTNPRADLEGLGISTETRRIIRNGIPFGPEVSAHEAASKKTTTPRGLLFIAYQSNLVNGFQFIQQSWANAVGFPIKKPELPGFDPIIGQAPNGGPRTLSGTNPKSQTAELALPAEWVIPKGGEYFFSPSIPALNGTFALTGTNGHNNNGHATNRHDEL